MATEYEIVATDEIEPWERQPDEDQRNYLAFCIYRNLGPQRTYAATARELSLSARTISNLAHDHNWQERSDAWDFYQDRIFQAEMAERQRIAAREHMKLAQEALEVLRMPLEAMKQKYLANPEELSEKEVSKLMKIAQDSIRLMPSVMEAERKSISAPVQSGRTPENENINYGNAERISDVLAILSDLGVLDAFVSQGRSREVIDAEVVEMDDDRPDAEADGLPPS